jgi:hypothetical protein
MGQILTYNSEQCVMSIHISPSTSSQYIDALVCRRRKGWESEGIALQLIRRIHSIKSGIKKEGMAVKAV